MLFQVTQGTYSPFLPLHKLKRKLCINTEILFHFRIWSPSGDYLVRTSFISRHLQLI